MAFKCSIFLVKCQWHLVGSIGVNLGVFFDRGSSLVFEGSRDSPAFLISCSNLLL